MNRSVRGLLGAAALVPLAAAVAAVPAPADAAPGPATALLYDTAGTAYPALRALPDPVVQTGGQTAETATGAVDGVLRAAPGTSRVRSQAARCALNPGRTVDIETGARLPETRLPSIGKTPLGGLPEGDCLGARRAAGGTVPLPVPPGAAGKAGGKLLKGAGKVGGEIGEVAGMRPALPAGRRANMPVSMALPAGPPSAPAALGAARPGGPPAGSVLFPLRDRRATPVPSDDVLGQANGAVNDAGAGLDRTEQGVGQVVDVLKARKDPAARPADGPLSAGPLS
ncbi:hypothetical protein, partial [Actinomadura sp.]|uniref:hypothetical protein n=1 Tax=Actinomadura sp. TaxID=1989 RepID=UPI0037C90180